MIRMALRDQRLLLSVILTSARPTTSSLSSSPPMALTTIKTGSSRTSSGAGRTAREAVSVDSEALVTLGPRYSMMMISSRETDSALLHSVPAVSEVVWVEPPNP